MWQTLAAAALPLVIDRGFQMIDRYQSNNQANGGSPVVGIPSDPNKMIGFPSKATSPIGMGVASGTSVMRPLENINTQNLDNLTPEQRQNLQRAINDSGLNNQRFSDQSPGWEYRTGGAWQSPSGNAGGAYSQTQSEYNTISNPNLPVNNQNVPNQKPGIYNDLLRPVVRETGGQLAREATGYFTSGETGPLLSLLGKGATYLAGMI